jgi:transposase
LLKLLNRWREEAEKAGRKIERIAVAFEAGGDGFWLARWLRAQFVQRLQLKRAFLGWLRGERDHCKMVAIPTIEDEDAKRPNRGIEAHIIHASSVAVSREHRRAKTDRLDTQLHVDPGRMARLRF